MDKSPEYFMEEALKEARKALELNEIPIGAIVEFQGSILGRGHNLVESQKDPTAHAEMIAIRNAAQVMNNQRLIQCNLYVTIEPCAMCAGAIVLARLKKVYIGTSDPKTGSCGSINNLLQDKRLNHQTEIEFGILQRECQELVKNFFARLRKNKKL